MKKRGLFWIITPSALGILGIIIMAINGLTPADSGVSVILNLLAFLCIGLGMVAFIPGLIYGIIVLNRK